MNYTTARARLLAAVAATVAAVALAGCSTAPAAAPAAEDTAAPAPPAPAPTGCTGADLPADAVAVTTGLAEGRADPAPERVDVAIGSTVVFRVSADEPAEIHLHGYDVLADAGPGEPGCMEVVADTAGVYELEAHPGALLLQLAVR